MNRPTLLVALSALLVPAFAHADQTTVYKTKDANGNTVYSQIESTGAQTQRVDGRDPSLPPAAAEQPLTERQKACQQAEQNLKLLGSEQNLTQDIDGDGKPEPMTPEQITSEKDLAQRQVTSYCDPKPEA